MRSWSGASGRWGTIRRYLFERTGGRRRPGLRMTRKFVQARFGPMWASAPTEGLQEAWEKNPPVTASPRQPPLGKGAKGTGDADCHDQFANWSRNDTFSRSAVQARTGGVEPRPYGGVARGVGKESPSHGFAVPAPFRQGCQGGGGCGLPQPVCELASQ